MTSRNEKWGKPYSKNESDDNYSALVLQKHNIIQRNQEAVEKNTIFITI